MMTKSILNCLSIINSNHADFIFVFTFLLFVILIIVFNGLSIGATLFADPIKYPKDEGVTDDNFSESYIKKRIALVENKFTYAAYQNNSFYNFYSIYSPQLYGNSSSYLDYNWTHFDVKTNLDLLKDRPIPYGPFRYYSYPEYLTIPYKFWFDSVYKYVSDLHFLVNNLTDMDVHDGKIFNANGSNAYDVLFLFHNEYVTQVEYDNLKKFVGNGGIIVFTQANALFAEVSYKQANNSISLVKGHSWEVDGNNAKGSVSERWVQESRNWIGSNFLDIPSSYQVYYRNNPFDIIHNEEAYIINPNASVLIDYKAYNLTKQYFNATVAAYEMDYKKGKIIHLGIWSHTVYKNPIFEEFFNNDILPLALNGTQQDTPLYNNYLTEVGNFKLYKIAPECTSFNPQTRVISVICDMTLSQLYNSINDTKVINTNAKGDLILNASIKINPDSSLVISYNDTRHLKILNQNVNEPNYIGVQGRIIIDGVNVTSWGPNLEMEIHQNLNGTIPRPFILFDDAKGPSSISNSDLAFLGYNVYPKKRIGI